MTHIDSAQITIFECKQRENEFKQKICTNSHIITTY